MKKYFSTIKNNILFNTIEQDDLESILHCLCGKVVTYNKNDIIIHSGDPINFIGIVLSGSIQISKEDMEGNINILTKLAINDIFAEAFACAGIEESPVTVQATEECEILFLECKRIIKTCKKACGFHAILTENMIRLIARKNIMLNQKIDIMSKRTTRDKLLMFFDMQSRMAHSKKFTIAYNRESLAHYLCVDRSAMTRELSKLREEGLIRFIKNEFEIL